ncbi:MAG: hypothetical protein WBM69_29315 [Desulfobacterales bacterium]
MEWVNIIAILLSPLIAVQVTQLLSYNFDKVAILRGHYFPKGLGDESITKTKNL